MRFSNRVIYMIEQNYISVSIDPQAQMLNNMIKVVQPTHHRGYAHITPP